MSKRIALIGAGSTLFTRGIMGSLVTDQRFEDSTLVMMDINADVLSLMECYANNIVKDSGSSLKVEATTSLEQALEGADYVICTMAANDSQARGIEVEVPLSFGYHHSWGDTTGPSGVFRGLRHIPLFLELAHQMESSCPQAWLINITDPMAVLCRAIRLESRIRTIGFCDGPPYYRRIIEREIFQQESDNSLQIKMAGIDHLLWVLELKKDGEDLYSQLRGQIDRIRKRFPVNAELLCIYDYFPLPGGEHISEFFPFFLRDEATMGQYGLKQMDVGWHRHRREIKLQEIRRAVQGNGPLKPEPLEPEDEVLEIIHSIANDDRREFVLSLPNQGLVKNLPDYAVVEVPVLLGAEVYPLAELEIPPQLTGVLHASIVKDELTVQAALSGSRELVFKAVLMCPLIQSIDQARKITAAMFEALEDFLPVHFV